jgi:cytochrome P450
VADTVCWALYELARSPEHQETVRAEVTEVLEAAREREGLKYADLEKMTFTQAFMKVR